LVYVGIEQNLLICVACADYRSSTVFEMVTAGELLSDEDLMTSRPQVLYEVMKETFKESEQRPAFTSQ